MAMTEARQRVLATYEAAIKAALATYEAAPSEEAYEAYLLALDAALAAYEAG